MNKINNIHFSQTKYVNSRLATCQLHIRIFEIKTEAKFVKSLLKNKKKQRNQTDINY